MVSISHIALTVCMIEGNALIDRKIAGKGPVVWVIAARGGVGWVW